MRKLFANKEGVRTRLVKMAEMRVKDLDDSVRPDELKYVITETGESHESEVRIDPIRRNIDGLGMVWIKCPLFAAISAWRKEDCKLDGQTQGYICWKLAPCNASVISREDTSKTIAEIRLIEAEDVIAVVKRDTRHRPA